MDMNGKLSRLLDEVAEELGISINYIGKNKTPHESLSDEDMKEKIRSLEYGSDDEKSESVDEPKTRKR